jgi:hypothetical protein
MSEVSTGAEPSHVIINKSQVDFPSIQDAVRTQAPALAELLNWRNAGMGPAEVNRQGGLFSRDQYLTPPHVFAQFDLAQRAVEHDDVVGNWADTTEQMGFRRIRIECDDPQQQDVWNQIIKKIGLGRWMKQIWREYITCSNVNCAWRPGPPTQTFRVKKKTEAGNQPRKTFSLTGIPGGLTVIDPKKVVPYGDFMFGDEKLAYIASRTENNGLRSTDALRRDPVFRYLVTGPANLSMDERVALQALTGVSTSELLTWQMNPLYVFRHTATRSPYEPFATVRLKGIFELLDLKQQLHAMDRAFLLGATSYIVLIKVGEKDAPAAVEDQQALKNNFIAAGPIPVVVGDHTLTIEIITPRLDQTLLPEKYRLLDSLIAIRLYQIFHQAGSEREDDSKLLKVVAGSLEARREEILELVVEKIIEPIFEQNPDLTEEPRLTFWPRKITLALDPNLMTNITTGRGVGDVSRDSWLEIFDLVEEEEARRFENAARYDRLFKPPAGMKTQQAQDNPVNNLKGQIEGGEVNGGGQNPVSGRSSAPRGQQKD